MKNYCTGLHTDQDSIRNCCREHDVAYGINGTGTRAEADAALRECVKANGRPYRAWIMWTAVRAFGWAFYKRKG